MDFDAGPITVGVANMKTTILAFLASSALVIAQPMKPEFHYTIFIAKPANDIWSALTEKKMIDQYYMAPIHTLELKKGGKISYGGDDEIIVGHITELDAPKTLAHTFKFAGSDDPETRVSYEITPIGDAMCSLKISHTGFQAEDQTFADITGGWPVIASALKTLLETGHGLPWPKKKSP
jgi:uncharacterized protein YndB with AHSA1/START domain